MKVVGRRHYHTFPRHRWSCFFFSANECKPISSFVLILLCDNIFQVPVEGLDDIAVSLFNYCGVVSHFDIDETCLRVLIGRLRAEYVITNIGYIYIYPSSSLGGCGQSTCHFVYYHMGL